MSRGYFITFEGSEGAGKSTMISKTYDFLVSKVQKEVICIREPGGTPLAEQMRAILKTKTEEKLCDKAELLLMYAARAQLVESLIKPKLDEGYIILGDRHDLSTLAYQGGGRGLSFDLINKARDVAIGNFKPDLTILMDLDVKLGMQRARQRGQLDRFEIENLNFFERVRQTYLDQSKIHSEVKIVDASLDIDAVYLQIENILKDFFNVK